MAVETIVLSVQLHTWEMIPDGHRLY
jgi:hypothetical protein